MWSGRAFYAGSYAAGENEMKMNKDKMTIKDSKTKRKLLRRQKIHLSIIHAAEKIIISKSYTAMTMDDVAREACLSKATLYKYIPGKGRILFEIARHALDEVEVKVRRVADSEAGASEKLRAIIAEVVHFHKTKRNIGRMLMMDKAAFKFLRLIYKGEGKAWNEDFRKSVNLLKRKTLGTLKLISRIIEEGVASGEFQPVDPMETVFFIESLLAGINRPRLWEMKLVDWPEDELSEKIFVFIYSSIRKWKDSSQRDQT
jgi:AcrR family transcriptional regulator